MPVIVIQDFSQLKQTYTREEAEAVFNMAGNILYGQVGIVADDPLLPIRLKAFHCRIRKDHDAPERRALVPLPQVRSVDEATVRAAYEQISKDIRTICDDLTEMLRNDPTPG